VITHTALSRTIGNSVAVAPRRVVGFEHRNRLVRGREHLTRVRSSKHGYCPI
jgi:hypothetical protein